MKSIFYSWQLDRNKKTNKNFLKKVLEKAVSEINKSTGDVPLKLDMDTQNRVGFVDINQVILEKIQKSDIFVADITSIGEVAGKSTPNPNVLFELGYAMGRIGEQRIICFANDHYEKIENFPFDLKTRRPFLYSISETDVETNLEYVKKEQARIASALVGIIKEMLLTPIITPQNGDNQTTRERDLIKLKRYMNRLPIKIVHKIIDDGKDQLSIDLDTINVYYNLSAIANFAYFRLYDSVLEDRIMNFTNAIQSVFSHGHEFFHAHKNIYRMRQPTKKQSTQYINEINELNDSLKSLVDYVFQNYKEIDLEECNKEAMNHYLEEHERYNRMFEEEITESEN